MRGVVVAPDGGGGGGGGGGEAVAPLLAAPDLADSEADEFLEDADSQDALWGAPAAGGGGELGKLGAGDASASSKAGGGGEALWRRGILVTIPVFMGYALLVSFQAKLKRRLGIGDDGARSDQFSFAVSFLYLGNLAFRLAHNVVFSCVTPRSRVYVAMGAMVLSMATLALPYYVLGAQTLAWVYVGYALGGVGVGSFESNFLSAITPFGHATKAFSIIGFPVGFALILVGAFLLTAAGVPPGVFYVVVAAALIGGMAVFATVPDRPIAGNAGTAAEFFENVRQWKEFVPLLGRHSLALMGDMFFASMMSGLLYYILDGDRVPLFGSGSSVTMPHDVFIAITNVFTLLGDSLSRRVVYSTRPAGPLVFLVASVAGTLMCASKVAVLAWPGMGLVYAANGAIYASGTRRIDTVVLKQFNLVSLSLFLFTGDIGSVAGSNAVPYVRRIVCRHHGHYICQRKP